MYIYHCVRLLLTSSSILAGLRDLVDFLPASLAAIISYFSAEVTRGIWKPVPMNGIDWPSPTAILPSIESEIKEILSAVGVNAPCCSFGKFCRLFFICDLCYPVITKLHYMFQQLLQYNWTYKETIL